MLTVALIFLLWDSAFTQIGIWGFNEDYITSIKVYNMPIEEILFFICIPYACTYTYYVFDKYVDISFPKVAKVMSTVLALVLMIIAILNFGAWYTTITFASLSLILAIMVLYNASYLDKFYVVYLIMLVPFFISNGLLTGSWVAEPIVWYNNDHNLGIRLLTIPIEDTCYAILMLLMNVAGYEYLKGRTQLKILKRAERRPA